MKTLRRTRRRLLVILAAYALGAVFVTGLLVFEGLGYTPRQLAATGLMGVVFVPLLLALDYGVFRWQYRPLRKHEEALNAGSARPASARKAMGRALDLP